MGFGLAKAIATPIMEILQNNVGISQMFIILGMIYFIMMFTGHLLIKKPDEWEEKETTFKFNIRDMLKNKVFMGIWIMFFINIHCGLALITYEKQIIQTTFNGFTILTLLISLVPSFTATFNALGRIGYSTISDKLKERNTIYKVIFGSCIAISIIALIPMSITNGCTSFTFGILVILLLLIINAGYGGGFSTLPALLSERFGMQNISKIHGLALSAWAIAGLTGNNMSELILKLTNNTYDYILSANIALYIIALIVCVVLVGNKKRQETS